MTLELRLASAVGADHVLTDPQVTASYDVDWTGTGRLVAHATAYDVPAGHSLAVVLDTADPLYLDANRPATPITVAGSSWLDVPMR